MAHTANKFTSHLLFCFHESTILYEQMANLGLYLCFYLLKWSTVVLCSFSACVIKSRNSRTKVDGLIIVFVITFFFFLLFSEQIVLCFFTMKSVMFARSLQCRSDIQETAHNKVMEHSVVWYEHWAVSL